MASYFVKLRRPGFVSTRYLWILTLGRPSNLDTFDLKLDDTVTPCLAPDSYFPGPGPETYTACKQ